MKWSICYARRLDEFRDVGHMYEEEESNMSTAAVQSDDNNKKVQDMWILSLLRTKMIPQVMWFHWRQKKIYEQKHLLFHLQFLTFQIFKYKRYL